MDKLDRRGVCRAVLFTFAAVLGKFDILTAQHKLSSNRGPGQLTVNLGQWGGIVFKHKGQSVTVSMEEVFNALAAENPRS